MDDRPAVEDTIEWLRDRGYYAGQIRHQETVPGQTASAGDLNVDTSVALALTQQGIDNLYEHQVKAINSVRDGNNAVVATPTASGKSLTYMIPAFERGADHSGKTLYIAPYRALINDQEETFQEYSENLGFDASVPIGVQTGKTDRTERRHIKDTQPDILLMTLDQVHTSLLPYAHAPNQWRWLFQQLETVVVDEVHMYRGVFGSHASLVFQRLARLCDYYDANLDYICCSATIGNPVEHAAAVTGQAKDSFTLVDEDTSATGDRHWLLWNPPLKKETETTHAAAVGAESNDSAQADGGTSVDNGADPAAPDPDVDDDSIAFSAHDEVAGGERRSHHIQTVRLFCDLVAKGYQTLVFTSARQGAEQYVTQADSQLRSRGQHDLAESIFAYHAALDSDRRQTIEEQLGTGDARGVWSTEALELGIDIGTLDVVLLDGYPGTTMSTFQRAGRAGRGDDSCLIILVASDDPLDQYVLREPEQLFEGGAEKAAVNPHNDAIRPDHVVCGAGEWFLRPEADKQYFGEDLSEIVTEELEAGRLERVDTTSVRWGATNDDIQWETDIRGIDDRSITLVDAAASEPLGSLEFSAALRDAHPNAIYHHQKRTFEVGELDLEDDKALLHERDTTEYTRALREKNVSITDTKQTTTIDAGEYTLEYGLTPMTVSDTVTGYMHFEHPSDDTPVTRSLDEELPPYEIDTMGLFIRFPTELQAEVVGTGQKAEEDFLAGLHAIEHALISLFPMEILCDRGDVGGLSTTDHISQTGGTVFVHDGYKGGAGLTRQAFDCLETLLGKTEDIIKQCGCSEGCPSCIHSPHCGNANRSLDKQLAVELLSFVGTSEF